MIKRLFLLILIVMTLFAGNTTAKAAAIPGTIYVDSAYTGTEDGTAAHPYNTRDEAISAGQALAGGAWIWEKINGNWKRTIYVSPVISGGTGLPLPTVSLYVLLAVVALAMAVAGLQLRRRSRQLQL